MQYLLTQEEYDSKVKENTLKLVHDNCISISFQSINWLMANWYKYFNYDPTTKACSFNREFAKDFHLYMEKCIEEEDRKILVDINEK